MLQPSAPVALIAMDMDGTLLSGSPGRISPGNLAALREAHARGIHLAIASGRVADDAGFFAHDAGLPMHILALNGGTVLDQPFGEIIISHHIRPADVDTVLSLIAHVYPCTFCCFADHDLVVNCSPDEAFGKAIQWGTHVTRAGSRSTFHTDSEGLDRLRKRGISKFLLIPKNPAHIPLLRETILADAPGIEVTSSWVDNLELNPKGVHKGSALTELAARLHIPMGQTMALGDNGNDVSMLRAAGFGVAMGNSTPEALAAADYVTLSCAEDGVAAAIRALAFGESVIGVRKR